MTEMILIVAKWRWVCLFLGYFSLILVILYVDGSRMDVRFEFKGERGRIYQRC
jgi:hypothetical protein